jgi:hypothetical protein
MLIVSFSYCYAECRYADFCYAECRYVECHCAEGRGVQWACGLVQKVEGGINIRN